MIERLREFVESGQFRGIVPAPVADALAREQGCSLPELALVLPEQARRYAVAPISQFRVGAIGVGRSGALYFGANLEVIGAALSFTLHAEQAAVANAWIAGEGGLAALAVSAAPCGYCRQFLHELADAATVEILLPAQPGRSLSAFLPDAFGPRDLGIEGGLMQAAVNGLRLDPPPGLVAQAALEAANASYAPYTKTFAGVALATADGSIFTGRLAENAAYNPSLSPLPAALSQLVLAGRSFAEIVEAVLVEGPGPASQASATQAVLACVSAVPLSVLKAS